MDTTSIPDSKPLKFSLRWGVMTVIVMAAIAGWWLTMRSTERKWFAIQRQQLALINQLAEFPPPVSDARAWREEIVTLHNVWGNVTFSPSYSQLTVTEMLSLQHDLEQILATTSAESSHLSVEQVFELLLERGQKPDFINGYREDFRSRHPQNENAETGRLFRLLELVRSLRC